METGSITERAQRVQAVLEDEFASLYTRRNFEEQFRAIQASMGRSDCRSKWERLIGMLSACGIPYESGMTLNQIRSQLDLADLPRDYRSLEDRILYILYDQFCNYASPAAYMKRLVDWLCRDEDPWQQDSVKLRILKQFVKYGRCLSYPVQILQEDGSVRDSMYHIYGGETYIRGYLKNRLGHKIEKTEDYVDEIRDDIFSVLKRATKNECGKNGKYGLLKVCEDLANGNFRSGGATRKNLYLFAMAFGMTYYPSAEKPGDVRRRDVEINLFEDYYTNNLLRFLNGFYEGRLSDFEREPAQGIHYRNYAEVVSLYYIYQDLTPWEKISGSDQMIRELQNCRCETKEDGSLPWESTGVFRDAIQAGPDNTVLNLPRDEFRRYILSHFDCTGSKNVCAFGFQPEQNSAFRQYRKIIENLEALKIPESELKYGFAFTDGAALENYRQNALLDRIRRGGAGEQLEQQAAEQLGYVLQNMDRFIGCGFQMPTAIPDRKNKTEDITKKQVHYLHLTDKSQMTRSALIVAFYYYFNSREVICMHRSSVGSAPVLNMSLAEYFAYFKMNLDPFLQKAYYQSFSRKNFFDVLVALSSYFYVYDNSTDTGAADFYQDEDNDLME